MVLPAWVWPVIDLYFLTRRHASPLGGRPLPCPGSPGDQPAALMDAFLILDAEEKEAGEKADAG